MQNLTKALRKKESERGFSIIEVLIAMAVFIIAIGGVQATVSAGLTQIKEAQVDHAAEQCARIIIEYMSTVPPDIVYKQSQADGGNPVTGTFTSGGIPSLNAFAGGGVNSTCNDLSSNPKVGLRYVVCPGCVAATTIDASNLVEYSTCYYTIKGTVYYNGLIYKRLKHMEYDKKFYGRRTDTCENICGKGGIPPPGQWAVTINSCNI